MKRSSMRATAALGLLLLSCAGILLAGPMAPVGYDPAMGKLRQWTGSAWADLASAPAPAAVRGVISVDDDFHAVGDGMTDDSPAFNAAIASLAGAGGTIQLGKAIYAIGAPLDGAAANVCLRGLRGRPTLKKLPVLYGSFLHVDRGSYSGWRFEDLTFDGNGAACLAAGLPGYTLHVQGARDLSFTRCTFREPRNCLFQGCRGVTFDGCDFLGTRPGVMRPGVLDPPANPAAAYGPALLLGSGNVDVTVRNCRFHLCQTGVTQSANPGARCRNLTLENDSFDGAWFNAPYQALRFTPTALDPATRRLTCAGTDFSVGSHFNDFQVLSVPIPVASGSAFARLYMGEVNPQGQEFTSAQAGDVIETADGRRTELLSVSAPNSAWIAGWESLDTFDPCPPPGLGTAWRLRRYFASICLRLDAHTLQVYGTDLVNPHTGEGLLATGRTPVGIECRELAKMYYTGLQVNGGQDGLLVKGCRFTSGWADQCSIFDSEAPQVIGCRFEMGQDEGITCTRCARAVLALNTFRFSGSSAIFLGDAAYASVTGNTVHSWNLTNANVRGAIENAGLAMTLTGNVFSVEPGASYGGASNYCFDLDTHSSAGTVLSGNVDGGARRGTLYVDAAAGAITARDAARIDGSGAANVRRQ